MAQVLVVDDEAELANAVAEYLGLSGIPAVAVVDAHQALPVFDATQPELVLLDVNMPGVTGFELCRSIRSRSSVPIIFLTARDTESDEILALSIGGDDFIRKPFSMAVLVARVRRVLDRGASTPPSGYVDDWLRVDLDSARVHVDGREVQVPATEYRLLAHLVARRGRVVSKQDLLDEVWGGFVAEGTLSVHVRRLRTRIEPNPDQPRYLRTVWGRGFLFDAPEA